MIHPADHPNPPNRHARGLQSLAERYGPFIFGRCLRELGNIETASAATRALLIAAARQRKLPKSSALAGWLFHLAKIADRKSVRRSSRVWWRRWLPRRRTLDEAIDRLRRKPRNAVLLRFGLNCGWSEVAQALNTSEARAQRLVDRAVRKLRGYDLQVLTATPLPPTLLDDLLAAISDRPKLKLARRLLRNLAWQRWRRRMATAAAISTILAIVGICIDARRGFSWSMSTLIVWSTLYDVSKYAEEAKPWTSPPLDASSVRSAADLYRATNIWNAHFKFTREQWNALDPQHIPTLPHFFRVEEGQILTLNPKAPRSGFIGVLGYAFNWSAGDLDFSGLHFTNAAIRIKGNVAAVVKPKRPLKVDLNRNIKGQKLAGLDELTFNSLVWDTSCLVETLAYQFFRDAGVPSPRTAFAWITVSIENKWDRKPLGLYLMLQPIDASFVADQLSSKNTPLFKPVTYDLFDYLGDNWADYAAIYDLKNDATAAQNQRIIEFARLLTKSNDAEFATRVGDYLDLDEFARYLACLVLVANYDSMLTTGQNFYMYLDPRSNKFGFIPWDMDAAWGNIWIATKPEFERASIWHPWAVKNRFLERVMAVEEFRRIYRAHLEDFTQRLLVADRIQKRIDEIAPFIRDAIAAESSFRLDKFEQQIGAKPVTPSPGETRDSINAPAYPYRKFIEARARSVRAQLDGKTEGLIIKQMSW